MRFLWTAYFFSAMAAQLSVSLPLNFNRFHIHTQPVRLSHSDHRHVIIDNGLMQVTVVVPDGFVSEIKYGSFDNLLEHRVKEKDRGHWDVVWYEPGRAASTDWMKGTKYRVVMQSDEQVELSFARKWRSGNRGKIAPLNVDKRFIVRRGVSGFYMYAILERPRGFPDVDMDEIRIVFKLSNDLFHYMAISDKFQRVMPTQADRESGTPLAYKEAVWLTNTDNPQVRGEVDDKYEYSLENQDINVIGWISDHRRTGFWMIKPSNEFCAGGPLKQELTAHVGPYLLAMFTSIHYSGKDLNTEYRNGDEWRKVFGPVFIYLNSMSETSNDHLHETLWKDAQNQMKHEVKSWPYSFPKSEHFQTWDRRGNLNGNLLVQDGKRNSNSQPASFAYVGLAEPREPGSWQYNAKNYQFWTRSDEQGNFVIRNVVGGEYTLHAWVPGFIGNFAHNSKITIDPGKSVQVENLTFISLRNGRTIWEIGIPDRSAAEFYIPSPVKKWENKLFINDTKNGYRQYGIIERYAELYPSNDVVFKVGISNYMKDWFFAQVVRVSSEGHKNRPTTWQIEFEMESVKQNGWYTLQIALAAASHVNLEVRVNKAESEEAEFASGPIGKDNAVARHGIHGLYHLYSVSVDAQLLRKGSNTVYLTQSRADETWNGLLYDYIRLED